MASGLVALLGLFLLGDAAARGSWDVVLSALGPIAALVWVLWVLTVRPCVVLDDEALTIVNPLRRTRVPWNAVADVRLRWQIVVETLDGRHIQCIGGPSRPRRGLAGGVRPTAPGLDVVVERWQARRAGAGGPVERRWDVLAVTTGVVALVLLAVSLLG